MWQQTASWLSPRQRVTVVTVETGILPGSHPVRGSGPATLSLGDDTWQVSPAAGCHVARPQTATEQRRIDRLHVGASERSTVRRLIRPARTAPTGRQSGQSPPCDLL